MDPEDTIEAAEAATTAAIVAEQAVKAGNTAEVSAAVELATEAAQVEIANAQEAAANITGAVMEMEIARRVAACEERVEEWHGENGRGANLEAQMSSLQVQNQLLLERVASLEILVQSISSPMTPTLLPLTPQGSSILPPSAETDPQALETPPPAAVVVPVVEAPRKRRLRLL